MDATTKMAALFDFDGVIMDTETQYTVFWDEQGRRYLDAGDYGRQIKGQTLAQIYEKDFAGMTDVQEQITRDLNLFERKMTYQYLPGVQDFIADLQGNGVKIAVVTSSDDKKMNHVYRAHPEFKAQFDRILTAGMFARSKPAPDCFLLGMAVLGVTPAHSFVFEDSFHGLQAGMDSGATVIGLATTNSRESIEHKAHYVIDDFTPMTCERLLALRLK